MRSYGPPNQHGRRPAALVVRQFTPSTVLASLAGKTFVYSVMPSSTRGWRVAESVHCLRPGGVRSLDSLAGRQDTPFVGRPLRPREDARFIQGKGRYVEDILLRNTAWRAFVRSPHAHARIRAISTAAAERQPSILKVLTAADWAAAGHGELRVVHPVPFSDGRPMNEAPRPAFASGKVHHVGDVVAAVIAESCDLAGDGAEAV